MLGSRWNTFSNSFWGQMQQLQNDMNRLFGRVDGRGWEGGVFPALNVWEEDEALLVEAELPGLRMEDLEIFVTGNNQLTIKGQRQPCFPEKCTPHRQERSYGAFVRTLTLPFAVDDSRVEAKLENGVLFLHLPKHEKSKPRRIAVKA